MNILEALETAIRYEKQVRNAYVEARDQVKDPNLKKWFHSLAKAEHAHMRYLHDSLKLWKETGQLNVDTLSVKLDRAALENAVSRLKVTMEDQQFDGLPVLEILIKILSFETQTLEFYQSLAGQLSLSDGKFFDRFVKSEEEHQQLVRNKIQAFR